jgi:ABC-type amino acid transport substrate-binding protein
VLYGIDKIATVKYFDGILNDLAGVVIKGDSEVIILDAPDTFVALQKWPGQIKILGPVSEKQTMACAFRKEDREMLESFNQFLKEIQESGFYMKLIEKYYPAAPIYFPEFFQKLQGQAKNEAKNNN